MAFTKLSQLFKSVEDGMWIELDRFISYLRQHHDNDDKIKKIKRSNILTEIKGHSKGLKEIDGILHLTVTSALRYLFHHYDQQAVCRHYVNKALEKLFSVENVAPITLQEIYEKIVKLSTRNPLIEEHIFQNIEVDENDIPFLYRDYKKNFKELEWKKICYFEHHFGRRMSGPIESYEYEELLEKRLDFIREIESCNKISKLTSKEGQVVIVERIKRKNIASGEEDITIHIGKKHRPKVIEAQILKEFIDVGICTVLCVDCTKQCKHRNAVHIYIELQQDQLEESENLSRAISNHLSNLHQIECAEIFHLKPDTFLLYTDSFGIPQRFKFRDDLIGQKRNEEILFHWTNDALSEEILDENNDEKCLSCFPAVSLKPLSGQAFDILQEWTFDVPLMEQIFLEKFINLRSVKKTENLASLLRTKLTKLYTTYDILLNLTNRLYCGILQELNSQELSLNYQSVSTVFSVTQGSGATLSLNESERRLKQMANEDMCHYNTYLKKYEIEYETEAGICKKKVSLKDCHLILFMDNLVRLKFRADPSPGESRTKQLCTLPITLKGTPKDSLIVMSWHTEECDGVDNCDCKKERQIDHDIFLKEITQLSEVESSLMDQFQYLLSWGFAVLWKSVLAGEAPDLLDGNTLKTDCQPLETSFASLTLDENAPMEEAESIKDLEDGDFEDSMTDDNYNDTTGEDTDTEEDQEDTIDNVLSLDQDRFDSAINTARCTTFDRDFSGENSMHQSNADDCEIETGMLEEDNTQEDIDDNVDVEDESFVDNLLDRVDFLQIHNVHGFISDDDMDTFEPLNISTEQSKSENIEADEFTHGSILETLGFSQYKPPVLLTRHPPPATGRDDDLGNIRRVLDEILIKTDHSDDDSVNYNKILFGPDNKIGNILLKLIAQDRKYKIFLPEFPLLHLRKSKINTVCSAYATAGILHILKYMRDDDYKEWKKLISDDHIEQATKYIRRLSLAFHLAFTCKYLQSLTPEEADGIAQELTRGKKPNVDFEKGFSVFIENGMKKNATFRLHKEMMDHFDEISAIAFAERLGGQDGYHLLLSAVKKSLLLAFLNGASSYAAYSVNLLYQHMNAGPFYQKMKCALFTTPHKGSISNIALDAQREMDHKDVIKGFRTGSTMSSILPRMSLIDTLNEASNQSRRSLNTSEKDSEEKSVCLDKLLGVSLNSTDVKYVLRVATLIIRQDGLSLEENDIPYNVYSNPKCQLPTSILDSQTQEIGLYLLKKFVITSGLFSVDCNKDELPNIQDLSGPKSLLQKLKKSKGVTIKRISATYKQAAQTEKEKKEHRRKTTVKRESKKIDCITSSMNACQAILKPDCTKPKVLKSAGIQKALMQLTARSICLGEEEITADEIVQLAVNVIPAKLKKEVTTATIEFAGVKFKAKVFSGDDYIEFVKNNVILKTCQFMPRVTRMVICEEKYQYTPDDFKAATRAQRAKTSNVGISHLKTVDEMISCNRFDKASLISTSEGKSFISTYLARRVDSIHLNKDLDLVIDSELDVENGYTIPTACTFRKDTKPIIKK